MLCCERAVSRASAHFIARQTSTRVPRQLSPLRPRVASRLSTWHLTQERTFAVQPRRTQEQEQPQPQSKEGEILSTQDRLHRQTSDLPSACPGCGAPSQTVDPTAPGYYSGKTRGKARKNEEKRKEDAIYLEALRSNNFAGQPEKEPDPLSPVSPAPAIPICTRCHNLIYQSKGETTIHPSMQSIQQMIEESPHKQNHIYHVLDAADFPMSLIPNLQHALHLPRMRSQNRRSKHMHYTRGRVAEVSFVITRSDLLAPQKEQVDRMLPYLREVLRDALGRSDKNVRLGNIRCVSAHRGWWTREVKEDIWSRGGAGWMVGKVNVGKSRLFENVYPKGRNDHKQSVDVQKVRAEGADTMSAEALMLEDGRKPKESMEAADESEFAASPAELGEDEVTPRDPESYQESELQLSEGHVEENEEDMLLDEDEDGSLLPPPQQETAYPDMPVVSSIPGTTASPIRIPFGNGKGELIDLPGVHRSALSTHVLPEHHASLMMKSRPTPAKYTIKPEQSLLLGGLIRITPSTHLSSVQQQNFLAQTFLPAALDPHRTSTPKAVAMQTGTSMDGLPYDGTIENIGSSEGRASIARVAGPFRLAWDVTKRLTGVLTDPQAGKQKAAALPFRIWAADVLIEGCGWVELSCQVRRRPRQDGLGTSDDAGDLGALLGDKETGPEIEVYSPEGKFVAIRQPMCASVLFDERGKGRGGAQSRGRGRQTVSMGKRREGGKRGGAKVRT